MASPSPKTIRTPAQNRALWGCKSQLERAGLSPDDAEAALRRVTLEVSGQEHTSRLTARQAELVIDQLSALVREAKPVPGPAPHEPWGSRGPGPRNGAAITEHQRTVLTALFLQAGLDTTRRQAGFAMRQCKKPWAQSQRDYDQLYEALQAMVLRTVTPAEVLHRARALMGNPKLDAWERQMIPDLVAQLQQGGAVSTHKLKKLCEAEARCGVRP